MEESNKLAKVSKNLPNKVNGLVSITDHLENAKSLLKEGATSGLLPYDNPTDIAMVLALAEFLDMPYPLALANVYSINGKPSIGVHLYNAMLKRGGVDIELLEDAVDVYHGVGNGGVKYKFTLEELETRTDIAYITKDQYIELSKKDKLPSDKKIVIATKAPYTPSSKIQDKRTTVRMSRKGIDGKINIVTRSYYLHEAWKAGFIKVENNEVVGKDNWIYHEISMMFARCCTRTGKVSGPDLTLGFSETSELADANDIDYYLDENNNAIPVQDTE